MKRDYGIDLAKMLAMVMVVAHHVLMFGGVEEKLCANGAGVILLGLSIAFVIVR